MLSVLLVGPLKDVEDGPWRQRTRRYSFQSRWRPAPGAVEMTIEKTHKAAGHVEAARATDHRRSRPGAAIPLMKTCLGRGRRGRLATSVCRSPVGRCRSGRHRGLGLPARGVKTKPNWRRPPIPKRPCRTSGRFAESSQMGRLAERGPPSEPRYWLRTAPASTRHNPPRLDRMQRVDDA